MSNTYPETGGSSKIATCNFCSKLLGREYYFTCHVCGATYCYIHLARHGKAHKAFADKFVVA